MNIQWRLSGKYSALISGLVTLALVSSGGVGLWFSYQETASHLLMLQREKAASAASRIELYIKDIEEQIDWTAPPVATTDHSIEQRRLEYLKLLRHVPAISDVIWVDEKGLEQLRVSRLSMDLKGAKTDLSHDPGVIAAKSANAYFSPVHFRNETEPYLTIAKRAGAGGGVTLAEVNLKFIWDVISQMHIGKTGLAYATDTAGTLIAHPNISLVLQKTKLNRFAQDAEASGSNDGSFTSAIALNLAGEEVLTAHAPINTLDWRVYVELPTAEAFAPLYESLKRTGVLLLFGFALSVFAAVFLARRLVQPIRLLQDGAERIGAGMLDQRIEVHTGDELEGLASQFNSMAARLRESYAVLEHKVKERTSELVREQSKTRDLLTNILPESVIEELTTTGRVKPTRHEEVTVLFTDFGNFTQATASMPASRMVGELNEIFVAFDEITVQEGVEKIKTIGDAYMAAAGITPNTPDHAQRCTKAALRMLSYMEERNLHSAFKWELRIGLHSGTVVSGVVGKRKYVFDIWGDTVNVASRMESSGEVGRVNVSAYTYDLIQKDYECEYRGKVVAKGKGEIDMYFVKEPTSR